MSTGVQGAKAGRIRGMKLYDDPSNQAAFDRWLDITAQLLQKYGPVLLKQKGEAPGNGNKMEIMKPLESDKKAA